MDETYFKSSIVQYSIMLEYIAVREQHFGMSRVDTATRNIVEQDELSILNEDTSMLCRGLVHVTSSE